MILNQIDPYQTSSSSDHYAAFLFHQNLDQNPQSTPVHTVCGPPCNGDSGAGVVKRDWRTTVNQPSAYLAEPLPLIKDTIDHRFHSYSRLRPSALLL